MQSISARSLEVFWHPCGQIRDQRAWPPIEVSAAEGPWLELSDGRRVYDVISSWWCKALGHRHPGLGAAVCAQMERFEHVIVANTTNAALVSLCERVLAAANGLGAAAFGPAAAAGKAEGHYGRVLLADNGSTAVEIAVKMALQAQAQRGEPGRTAFASLENGYHGETVATLALGDLGIYAEPYRALFFPVQRLEGVPYRKGPHDAKWLDAGEALERVTRALEPNAHRLAAIVYEPVLQAAGGMLLYSPAFLEGLGAWARARGIYLIADEIAAGWGRLGEMLATHWASPRPSPAWADFVTLSKGLTAGFSPLSAVLTTDAVAALFDADYFSGRSFLHSNTYTGHALGVAAALAALDAFATEGVLDNVAARAEWLSRRLPELVERRPWIREYRHAGLVVAFDVVQADGAPYPRERRLGRAVQAEALKRGALLRPLGDTIYLYPPLNVSESDLGAMLQIVLAAIDAVAGAG